MSIGDKENWLRLERRGFYTVRWIDWDFDYNDQLAKKYMKFKGEYYDVGTIAKIKGYDIKPILEGKEIDSNFNNDLEV